MALHRTANERPARWGRGAAAWLGLAASPSFALMAVVAAFDAPRIAFCSPAPAGLPIDGMAWMYLLMSLFHLPAWLKSGRRNGASPAYCPH